MSEQTDGFTHTLERSKEVRGKTYTSLTVRRPLVRDLIAADRQPGDVAGRSRAVLHPAPAFRSATSATSTPGTSGPSRTGSPRTTIFSSLVRR